MHIEMDESKLYNHRNNLFIWSCPAEYARSYNENCYMYKLYVYSKITFGIN